MKESLCLISNRIPPHSVTVKSTTTAPLRIITRGFSSNLHNNSISISIVLIVSGCPLASGSQNGLSFSFGWDSCCSKNRMVCSGVFL